MAQSTSRGRVIGEYLVGKQIGCGSFSVVWHARHKAHGTEVAIKEIATARLNKKLQDSLRSEIEILKKINHNNIIHLHEMIEEPGKIHLVLEFCRGGDLYMYIQQHQGGVPEATAKHFMRQLAAGLKILRENNLIHRDLKPQNLLLSSNDDKSVLKIADFGFARSLQPRGLAETLCGSPLYMAPEIMQLQKYDAKADLWSVGAILFQLVTGKTPFTGNNQIQLLQNIVKSTELHFPPAKKDLSSDCIDLCQKLLRRNPVERLTFEEFFNHPFLSQKQLDESSRIRRSSRLLDGIPFTECNQVRNTEESSQEDCLPFSLDDDSSGPDGSPSFDRRPSVKSTYGFFLDTVDRRDPSNTSNNLAKYGLSLETRFDKMKLANALNNIDGTSKYSTVTHRPESTGFRLESHGHSKGKMKESSKSMDQKPATSRVVDSLELIDQDYVIVSGSAMDASSSPGSASKLSHLPCKPEGPPQAAANVLSISSAPVPIVGATTSKVDCIGSLESQSSAPSGTSQGSMDLGDALEQPSANCMTRINSLWQCASAIREIVIEKVAAGRQLEAFSIQLVILATLKQAVHICHTQAASAMDGSPSQETARLMGSVDKEHCSHDIQACLDTAHSQRPQDICSQVEREFIVEVENADEIRKVIELMPGNMKMPDAMEAIFQSALDMSRHGGVEEYLGGMGNAEVFYSKSVRLLVFLLVEAPSLILNPPFSLKNSDRHRLRKYIDAINTRLSHSRTQRMALLKGEDQQCAP